MGDTEKHRRFVGQLFRQDELLFWMQELWDAFNASSTMELPSELEAIRALFEPAYRSMMQPAHSLSASELPGWCGLESLGGQAPVQADGVCHGHPWYFRARGSAWSLEVAGAPGGEVPSGELKPGDFAIEAGYGFGEFDASYMPENEARWFIVRGLECFVTLRFGDLERAP